mgnify:CR=1 FL=1
MPAGTIERFDANLLGAFDTARTPTLDAISAGITWLGSLWLLLPLALLAGWRLAPRNGAIRAVIPAAALLASSGICHAVKVAADRSRPGLHEALVALPSDAAFPSAHAAQAMALALALALARSLGGDLVVAPRATDTVTTASVGFRLILPRGGHD